MISTRTDWKQLASRMWAAQSRADLNERPRLLLAWIIRGTVECGRLQLLVPDMTELFAEIRIGKNHHREVRVALMDAGIVKFNQVAEGWMITVFSDPERWTCEWKHDESAKVRWLARMNALPGQCQGELLESEPSLTAALAEVSAEAAIARPVQRAAAPPGSSSRNGNCRPVPVLGTPLNTLNFNLINQFNSERVASEIVTNKHGWHYDNCKVRPDMFPFAKSIQTAMMSALRSREFTEADVIIAWQEAVTRTHKAVVDGVVQTTVPGYCIACFKQLLIGQEVAR